MINDPNNENAKKMLAVVRGMLDEVFNDGDLRILIVFGGNMPAKDREGMLDQLIIRLSGVA